jgi:hypothetical protein
MFRKLTVIAVAALACSGAMAATETFNFNTQGGTLDAVAFNGSIFGYSLSSVQLDGVTTNVNLVGSGGGYSSYLFSVNSPALSHTVSWVGTNLGTSANWTSTAHTATPLVLTNTPAVPEPETYAMMLAGLGALGFVGRRRKAK